MWPIRSSRSAVAFARLALAVLAIVVAGGGAVAPVLLNRQGRPPAATGGEAAGVTVGEPRDDRVVITRESRDGGALPAGCGPREVAHLIARFFDAFNRGDQDALAAVVFRSPLPGVGPSQWYSVAEAGAPPFAAYDLDAFLAYAAERHRRHERLRLVAVSVSGPGWHGGAGVVYALTRHADERPRWPSWPGGGGGGREQTAVGKGAIDCVNQSIRVWSMTVTGEPWRAGRPGPCPAPPRGTPPAAILACGGQGA